MGPSVEREGESFFRRVELVMAVQRGEKSAREAAAELGISPKHYYRLEERILKAAVEAASPRKRGPKPRETEDPQVRELEERLRKSERERELLEIRNADLEEIRREMTTRAIGVESGGKIKRRPRSPRPRKPVSGGVPPDGAGSGGGPAPGGKDGGGPV